MTVEASLSNTMPEQEALIRFQKLEPAHQRLIIHYVRNKTRAPTHEQIKMAERLRVLAKMDKLKEELLRAINNPDTVSDEQLTQFKRRWRMLGGSTKEKKLRASNTTGALQNEAAAPARPDTGNKHNALARALAQALERRDAQKTKTKEAKRRKPWRNVPQFHAKCKAQLKHRPARAQNDNVRAYRLRLIQES